MALRGEGRSPGIVTLARERPGELPFAPQLAWGMLALAAYRNRDADGENALAAAIDALLVSIEKTPEPDVATGATCALALEAVDGANVFEV